MNNPLISAVMGRKLAECVPVPCAAVPARTYRERVTKLRQRRREEEGGEGESEIIPEGLCGVLGEGKGDVIPDDAEELDTSEIQGNITTRMTSVKDTVEEPGRPRDPDELFISPKTALTAPDATPDNMTQSDPSKIPGVGKTTFTVPELEQPAAEGEKAEMPVGNDNSDGATRTMDLILGRRRVGAPAKKAEEFAATGAVRSEAQAQAMLGITLPGMSGDALLRQGMEMPPPVQGDNKTIYEAARRWV